MRPRPNPASFSSRRNFSFSLAAAAALVLANQSAPAAELYWQGPPTAAVWNQTDDYWTPDSFSFTNWNNSTPDSAIFDGSGAGTVTLGENITVGNLTFNVEGYTIAGGGHTLTLSNTTISGTSDATISASLAGNTGLTITNTGATGTSRSVTLSGNNTYSGPTIIAGGDATKGVQVLRLNSANALGNSNDISVENGSSLQLGTNEVFGLGKTLNLTGTGVNFYGALHAASNANATWAGTIVLNSGARIGAISGGKLTLSGPIQKGSSGALVISAYGEVTIAGNQNTYDGNTEIIRGVLKLGVDNALPATTALNVDSSTANEDSIFDLNGFNQTVRALIRTNSTGNGGSFVTNNGTSAATLTIASNVTQTYNGIIQDGTSPLSLVKSGSGTQTLSGANSYSGDTTVNEGTLVLSGNNTGNTSLIVNGGILNVSGSNTGNNSLTVNGGTANLSGTIAGNSAVTVNGGALSVTGSHASSAAVTVNGGTLTVGGAGGNFASNNFRLNGGSFVVENSGTGTNNDARLADTANFSLNGGSFLYKGANESGVNSSETIGSFSLAGKRSTITVQSGDTNTATLTVGQLNRTTGGGSALVNGVNLGTASTRLLLTNAPTLVGTTDALPTGINTSAKNTKIVPYLVGEASVSTGAGTANGTPNTFLTYDPTTGLRPLSLTTEFENSVVSGANVRITTTGNTVNSSTEINSLILAAPGDTSFTISGSAVLTNTSGALLFTATNRISGGTLNFGSAEAVITANANAIGLLSTKITGTGGLSFFGPGTIALSSANTYSGGSVLHSGTVAATINSSSVGGTITSGPFGTGTVVFAGSAIRTSESASDTPTVIGNALRFEADTTFGATSGRRLEFTGPATIEGDTRTLVNLSSKGATFSGVIGDGGQNNGLTLAGNGTGSVLLSGENTYTGPTTIQSSTMEISGSIAASTEVAVHGTGTLILSGLSPVFSGEGRIGDNSPLTLGTISGSGTALLAIDSSLDNGAGVAFEETLGDLTVSSHSIIDFGNGDLGAVLRFAESQGNLWTGTLSIYNWTGSTIEGGGVDQIFFGDNQFSLTPDQVAQITFYSDAGTVSLGHGVLLPTGELIPEPSAALSLFAMFGGLLGGRRLRRRVSVEG